MKYSDNLLLIKDYLQKHGLQWLIIPREDEFLGEYVPACHERLLWASGFSGSSGFAVIGSKEVFLFVDGRYTLQATYEALNFKVLDISDVWTFLPKVIQENERIGLNLKLHRQQFVEKLKTIFLNVEHIDPHPVDTLWINRPNMAVSKLIDHPLIYAGEHHHSKLNRLIQSLLPNAEALYVNDPHDVAWLLNIRGQDVVYTPIVFSKALVWKDGHIDLFLLTHEAMDRDIKQRFSNHVTLHPMKDIDDYLLKPNVLQIDHEISAYDKHLIAHKGVPSASPILLMRSIKNSVEIEGMRKAHAWDGQALRKFRHWILNEDPTHVDEISAAHKLESFRKECYAYQGPSFPTISAFGHNAAVVHYRANPLTNQTFKNDGLYLVDSGGQYLEGTTDVTRVFPIGNSTDEHKKAYTLVLKGHLRLATAVFPKGTTGHQLDGFARYDLWSHGFDYAHGTGHGVGSYLSVHEGPASISCRANSVPLQPGMVLSNEPGYYKPKEFGIRIENMMVVKESDYEGFLNFETLTKVPYETALIDESLLNEHEKKYIFDFNGSLT